MESDVVKESIQRFSSSVQEQIQEKVGVDTGMLLYRLILNRMIISFMRKGVTLSPCVLSRLAIRGSSRALNKETTR